MWGRLALTLARDRLSSSQAHTHRDGGDHLLRRSLVTRVSESNGGSFQTQIHVATKERTRPEG